MPSTTLLLWVLTHALLLPHEPATFSLLGPGDLPAGRSAAGLIETGIPAIMSDRFDASGTGVATAAKLGARGGIHVGYALSRQPPSRACVPVSTQASLTVYLVRKSLGPWTVTPYKANLICRPPELESEGKEKGGS